MEVQQRLLDGVNNISHGHINSIKTSLHAIVRRLDGGHEDNQAQSHSQSMPTTGYSQNNDD